MGALIHIENMKKIYNPGENEVRALDGIDLDIEKGDLVAIVGHSGSGKSTLMNMLGCLDTPTSGKYVLDGQDVAFASVLNSLSGMTSGGYATGITPEGEPEITFRFFRDRDSFSQVTLSFYAYNSTSCLVTLDGVSTVTVKRETAAELVSSVKNILK